MIYRRRVDKVSIERANDSHKQSIAYYRKMLEGFDKDPQRAERLAATLCHSCFYNQSRIGGASCTSEQCAFCDTVLHSGNTNVDVMCQECAKKTGLCRHCGCDMDLKNRRNRELPTPTPPLEETDVIPTG